MLILYYLLLFYYNRHVQRKKKCFQKYKIKTNYQNISLVNNNIRLNGTDFSLGL